MCILWYLVRYSKVSTRAYRWYYWQTNNYKIAAVEYIYIYLLKDMCIIFTKYPT